MKKSVEYSNFCISDTKKCGFSKINLILVMFILFSLMVIGFSMACTDSDGKDFYTKGMTSGIEKNIFSSKNIVKTDVCLNNKVLKEYYCDNDRVVSENYVCANGCYNGACVKKPTASTGFLQSLSNFLSLSWLFKEGLPSAQGVCGNGVVDDPSEDCDRGDLDGADCVFLADFIGADYTGGTLACKADCTYDTSQCTSDAVEECAPEEYLKNVNGQLVCAPSILYTQPCDESNTDPHQCTRCTKCQKTSASPSQAVCSDVGVSEDDRCYKDGLGMCEGGDCRVCDVSADIAINDCKNPCTDDYGLPIDDCKISDFTTPGNCLYMVTQTKQPPAHGSGDERVDTRCYYTPKKKEIIIPGGTGCSISTIIVDKTTGVEKTYDSCQFSTETDASGKVIFKPTIDPCRVCDTEQYTPICVPAEKKEQGKEGGIDDPGIIKNPYGENVGCCVSGEASASEEINWDWLLSGTTEYKDKCALSCEELYAQGKCSFECPPICTNLITGEACSTCNLLCYDSMQMMNDAESGEDPFLSYDSGEVSVTTDITLLNEYGLDSPEEVKEGYLVDEPGEEGYPYACEGDCGSTSASDCEPKEVKGYVKDIMTNLLGHSNYVSIFIYSLVELENKISYSSGVDNVVVEYKPTANPPGYYINGVLTQSQGSLAVEFEGTSGCSESAQTLAYNINGYTGSVEDFKDDLPCLVCEKKTLI